MTKHRGWLEYSTDFSIRPNVDVYEEGRSIAIVGGGFPCIDRIQLFLFLPLGNPIVKLFIDRRGIIGIAVCTHVAFALVLAI